jgi:hypothetical protein
VVLDDVVAAMAGLDLVRDVPEELEAHEVPSWATASVCG